MVENRGKTRLADFGGYFKGTVNVTSTLLWPSSIWTISSQSSILLYQPTSERNNLDNLARSYDLLGVLVKHGVAPVEFVMDLYSRPLVSGW